MLTIELPEHLDIEAASNLKEALSVEHGEDLSVCIDARQVGRVGTACIQVILSAGRTLNAEGHPFAIVAPSPAFLTACKDLGLFEELQRWSTD